MHNIKKSGQIMNRPTVSAKKFIVMLRVSNLFADFTYEASYSAVEPRPSWFGC